MTKTKIFALVGMSLLIPALFVIRYINEFSRIKTVEIGNTPIELGTVSKVVLTNTQTKKAEFVLQCYFKVRSDGKPLFIQRVSIPPNGSIDFDVNPELLGKELPRMIAHKACEAIWQGPFGIERSAWWVSWQYSKPARKVNF